jgi:hypothetical protein
MHASRPNMARIQATVRMRCCGGTCEMRRATGLRTKMVKGAAESIKSSLTIAKVVCVRHVVQIEPLSSASSTAHHVGPPRAAAASACGGGGGKRVHVE